MCDYSLHNVASRPAKVGDRLVSTRFCSSITRGFAEVGEPNVAVCLLPGTEVAFDKPIEYERGWNLFRTYRTAGSTARFRQVDMDRPAVHHDALETALGDLILVNDLCEGQHVTVLQLPSVAHAAEPAKEPERSLVNS